MCEMHYYRLRRTGTTDPRKPKDRYDHSGGYIQVRAPDHPLANPKHCGIQYEHRIVFYDHHGEGPFRCHWCPKKVTWRTMHVDHLNADKRDNSPSNLVPSCGPCNRNRSRRS